MPCSCAVVRRHELTDGQWLRPSPNAQTSRPTAAAVDQPTAVHPRSTPVSYQRRNVVERRFQRLEQHRAIATRYDKTATSYQGMIDLTTLLMWL